MPNPRSRRLKIDADEESQIYGGDEYGFPPERTSTEDEWNEIISRDRSDEGDFFQDHEQQQQLQSRRLSYSSAEGRLPLAPPSRKARDGPTVSSSPRKKSTASDRTGRTKTRSVSRSRQSRDTGSRSSRSLSRARDSFDKPSISTSVSNTRGSSRTRRDSSQRSSKERKRSHSMQVVRLRSSPRNRSRSQDIHTPRRHSDTANANHQNQEASTLSSRSSGIEYFGTLRRQLSNASNISQQNDQAVENDNLKEEKNVSQTMYHIRWLPHGSFYTGFALVISWVGVAFAVLARQNINFVKLEKPWHIASIYKEIDSLGIINARLCYNETVSTLYGPDNVGCFSIPLATNEDIDDPVFKVSAIFISVATLFGGILTIFLTTSVIWRTINFRVLGTGYLFVYCFQSLSFLFFNTELCHSHDCKVDVGCIYCILASMFWLTSCLTCAKMDSNRVKADYAEVRKQRKTDAAKKVMANKQSSGTVTTERTSSTYSDELTVDFDEEMAQPLKNQSNVTGFPMQQYDMCNVGMALCNDDSQCSGTNFSSPSVKRHSTGALYPQQDLNKFIKTPTNMPSSSLQDSRGRSGNCGAQRSTSRSRSHSRHGQERRGRSLSKSSGSYSRTRSQTTRSRSLRSDDYVRRNSSGNSSGLEKRARSMSKSRPDTAYRSHSRTGPERRRSHSEIPSHQQRRTRSLSKTRIDDGSSNGSINHSSSHRKNRVHSMSRTGSSRHSHDDEYISQEAERRHTRQRSVSSSQSHQSCHEWEGSSSKEDVTEYWQKVQRATVHIGRGRKTRQTKDHKQYEPVQMSSPGLTSARSSASTTTLQPAGQRLDFVTSYFDI